MLSSKLICFLFLVIPFIFAKVKVSTTSQYLVDSYNRSLHLHGLNAVYKAYPYYPNYTSYSPLNSLCEQDFQNLQKWGFNFLRLYAPWPGIESVKGQYNQTFVDQLKQIVNLAEKYGVYILMDAHQDIANRKFCGEGFPDWTVTDTKNFPEPIAKPDTMDINSTTQYPNLTNCLSRGFGDYYPTYGVSTAFQNLYSNVNNLSDHFAAMWKFVAQNFNQSDIVLGYEIINEPWFGDIFNDKALVMDADQKNLQPLYKKVAEAIRTVDNNTLIFFEPVAAEEVYINMNSTPQGSAYHSKEQFNTFIKCFHSCGFQERSGLERDVCNAAIDVHFDLSYKKGKELGAGMFVTEFGAKEENDEDVMQLNYTINKCETNFLPWQNLKLQNICQGLIDYTTQLTGAAESLYFTNGSLQENKLKILQRSYFYAICGTPVSTSFEAALLSSTTGGTLQFSFYPANCQPKNTEFYLSEDYYYPNGFNFSATGCNGITYNKLMARYYELIVPSTCIGKLVSITITQKSSQQIE